MMGEKTNRKNKGQGKVTKRPIVILVLYICIYQCRDRVDIKKHKIRYVTS